MLVAVLHLFRDSDDALVAELGDAPAPGSFIVISHGTTDGQAAGVAEAMGHYDQTTATFRPRRRSAVMASFDGLEMAPPGWCPFPSADSPVPTQPSAAHDEFEEQ